MAMAEKTDPNRAHSLLVEAVRDLVPGPDDPAEPYWVLVAVTVEGTPTGAMFAVRAHGFVLYARRQDAVKAPPPSQEILHKPAEGVRWEVRGMTKELLEGFRKDPAVLRTGVVVVQEEDSSGRLAIASLPSE